MRILGVKCLHFQFDALIYLALLRKTNWCSVGKEESSVLEEDAERGEVRLPLHLREKESLFTRLLVAG